MTFYLIGVAVVVGQQEGGCRVQVDDLLLRRVRTQTGHIEPPPPVSCSPSCHTVFSHAGPEVKIPDQPQQGESKMFLTLD